MVSERSKNLLGTWNMKLINAIRKAQTFSRRKNGGKTLFAMWDAQNLTASSSVGTLKWEI